MSGRDHPQIGALLRGAQGYAVFDRERKRIGAFVELAGNDRIVIRHDGVLIWHRRVLPIATVAKVIPDQRAVVLGVDRRTLAEKETPPTPAGESGITEEDPHPGGWRDRLNRYVGPVEGEPAHSDLIPAGTQHETSPQAEDTREQVARTGGEPAAEPRRNNQGAADGHLLFISTPGGYSVLEREGPPPPLGERIEIPQQTMSFVVIKLGASPLPNDRRSCAYLEPTP